MLKNFWYACELSSLVKERPRAVRLAGRELVLYRDRDGGAHAVDGRCVHRGGALADGQVEDACVRCPYHGWLYGPDGACVEIPSQARDLPISARARIRVYPVTERYGWVWVFVGDLAASERPPLPGFAEAEDPDWRCIQGEFLWHAEVGRVIENALDIAHAAFVHGGTFGNPRYPRVEPLDVQEEAWGAHVTTSVIPKRRGGLLRLLGLAPERVEFRLGFHLPGVTRLDIRLDRFAAVLMMANLPVDETTTRTLYIQARNAMTTPLADAGSKRRLLKIFEEDRRVVEAIRPRRMPLHLNDEVSVRADRLAIAYRRRVQALIEQGWGLDADWRDPA